MRKHIHAHTLVHLHATHMHTEECWGISRIVKFLSINSQTNAQTKQTSQNLPTSNLREQTEQEDPEGRGSGQVWGVGQAPCLLPQVTSNKERPLSSPLCHIYKPFVFFQFPLETSLEVRSLKTRNYVYIFLIESYSEEIWFDLKISIHLSV